MAKSTADFSPGHKNLLQQRSVVARLELARDSRPPGSPHALPDPISYQLRALMSTALSTLTKPYQDLILPQQLTKCYHQHPNCI